MLILSKKYLEFTDMNNISVSAQIAWQIAAGEAAMLKHQYIEKEHILIGICSIEKEFRRGATKAKLNPPGWQSLEAEYHALEAVLHGLKIDSTLLRRQVRKRLGQGNYERNENEKVVHRSVMCKNIFNRADELVTSDETLCFHLLAAIMEEPGNIIGSLIDEAGVKPEVLRECVLAYAEKKDKDMVKKFERNIKNILNQYKDASKELSSKERENLYNKIKTLIEKLEKTTSVEEIANIIREITVDIRKAKKKTIPVKNCKKPLKHIEEYLPEADIKSIRNILITSLKKKFDEIKY